MADDGGCEVLEASDEVTDCSHDFEQVHSPNVNPNEEILSHISENVQTEPINDVAVSEANTNEEDESDSIMADIIANGLSQLGRSANGTMQVFLTLCLTGKELTDISALKGYEHLQTVILSHNNISDLSALGHMESLIKLDASHNKLTKILDFLPPKNLLEVDLSHNDFDELTDLSCNCHLVKLKLDYNNIDEIKGISFCSRLKHLSISHNKIQRIIGLTNLPLTHLDLSYNNIKKVENIETLKYLKVLDLSMNNIRSLKGLQNHEFLQEINLEGNQLIDIAEIRYIRELRLLRNLNLHGNPIQEMPDYRLSILYRLQMLSILDKVQVTASEKVHAINMFNPPRDVIAARDHMVHVVRSLVQPARVFDRAVQFDSGNVICEMYLQAHSYFFSISTIGCESTLTSMATPYPMLVLTGPVGSGKRFLTKRLCQEFPDYFGLGVSTTTRPRRKKEENGVDYYFISQEDFERDVMEGKFLQTTQSGGYLYGITREAIESVARKGLACTLHMEFEGILSLKNTSFEPRYVLVLPETTQEHERRLREHGHYTEAAISQALNRVELYVTTNREKPGFYDMTIMSDDLHEVYKRLKMLVLEYLGMSPTTTTESEVVLCTYTDMSNDSRGSEDAPTTSSSTTTTNMSRSWSRPRSNVSNGVQKPNLSLQSSKISPVEQESLARRRVLAKAALAGIPYVSKERLHELRRAGYNGDDSDKNFSTLFKLERSLSAPVELRNSYFSLLANVSNLTSNPQELGATQNGSDLDSDSETLASSSTPSSARAFSPNMSRADTSRADSDDSRQFSLEESLGTFEGSTRSGSGVREEILGNSI